MSIVVEESKISAESKPVVSGQTSLAYRPGLDIVRFFAAVWVMLTHAGAVEGGGHAVAVFFVLSGYLIGGQLFKEKSRTGTIRLSEFYFKRITRIWLPYYLVLFGMLILFIARGQHQVPGFTERTIGALTYTYNFVNDIHNSIHPTWISFNQIWSLSIEEQFYLIAPLIVICIPARWLLPACVALTGVLLYFQPLYAGLVVGVLLATVLEGRITAAASPWVSLSFGIAALLTFAGLFYVGQTKITDTSWLTLILSALLIVLAGRVSLPVGWHEGLRTLGLMTYSYYMIHGLPGYFLGAVYRKFTGDAIVPLWLAICFGLLALPVSYLFVRWIELPSLRKREEALKAKSRWIRLAPWIAWGLNTIGLLAICFYAIRR
jgi:peptidoglycan/LPS O-acetylase OafA/YrhL